ncbi:hypothetical protein KAR91_70270 [Candidatus Pacearchaeota archaeon]|nr:hypothetical protein [Candidatus Pacearchaeota archaeon]
MAEKAIEITTKNLEETQRFLKFYPLILKLARRSGLSSTGDKTRRDVRKFVESGGEGTWDEAHPMQRLTRAKGRRWRRRFPRRSPFHFLGKFARYKIARSAFSVRVRFGRSKSGEQGDFDKGLERIAKRAQEGTTTQVTPSMRRLFGLTRRSAGDVAGQDFFPLKGETTTLETPGRPIYDPVFSRHTSTEAGPFFEKKFLKSLERNEKRIDRRINK